MKMQVYKINYHSLVDVITNSSSELFVCSDKKVIGFFKELLGEKQLRDGFMKIKKYKDFIKRSKEHIIEGLKDDDDVLVCYYTTDEFEFALQEFLERLKFKSYYD